MKNATALAAFSAAGGAAAFFLRLAQERVGFSPDTGLSVPGNLPGRLLCALLVFLGAALLLLCRRLPARRPDPRPFRDVFSVQGTVAPLLGGVALLVLSGAAEARSALSGSANSAAGGELPAGVVLASGILTALSALCLLPAVSSAAAGRRSAGRGAAPPALLLPAPAALVFRLVLDYRVRSANPVLAAYAPELLALSFAALSFFCLSSFAFEDGSVRTFSFFAGGTVVLCAAALADGGGLSESALLGGCALFSLGLLLSLRPGAARARSCAEREAPL